MVERGEKAGNNYAGHNVDKHAKNTFTYLHMALLNHLNSFPAMGTQAHREWESGSWRWKSFLSAAGYTKLAMQRVALEMEGSGPSAGPQEVAGGWGWWGNILVVLESGLDSEQWRTAGV